MKSRIYIDSWLKFKPYNRESSTDIYYLKLCNRLKDTLMRCTLYNEEVKQYEPDEINNLACFLTAYFEDQISGTNIWNTFVSLHKRLYNKPIPFFDVRDYIEGEINLADLNFLIWYFFKLVDDEYNYNPIYPVHNFMALQVMKVFEDEWEYAPENEKLLKFYQVDVQENDFYSVRETIRKILTQTYLFYFDTAYKLLFKYEEILEKNKDHDHIDAILQETSDNFLFKSRTKLLAMKGQEWLAEILTDEHPLYNDILHISDKIFSHFIYKDQTEEHIIIEHIASGKVFHLTKKSLEKPEELCGENEAIYMGIVRWKEEWWFTGVYFTFNADETFLQKEKNSMENKKAVNFLDWSDGKIAEILEEKQEAFLKFNKGSLIAFMDANQVPEFIDNYISFHNRYLLDKRKETSSTSEPELSTDAKPKKSDYKVRANHAIVFFNLKSGIEIIYDLASAFPLPENPFFDLEDSEEHCIDLLEGDYVSTELTKFFLEHCSDKTPYLSEGFGRFYVHDLDFMLRFWKNANYHTKPELTINDSE